MASKINCKHGLERKEEIQARRLRVKIESGDAEVLNKIREHYLDWLKRPQSSFDEYLKKIDRPLASAVMRVTDLKEVYKKAFG